MFVSSLHGIECVVEVSVCIYLINVSMAHLVIFFDHETQVIGRSHTTAHHMPYLPPFNFPPSSTVWEYSVGTASTGDGCTNFIPSVRPIMRTFQTVS